MRLCRLGFLLATLGLLRPAAHAQTAAALSQSIRQLTLDPQETYRVRDVHLSKGGVSLYFNEGVVSFARSVNGRIIAAVFSTQGVDAGDAELVLLPPQPAERASLASFTKSPNLDEHFNYSVLFFSDATRDEILHQLHDPADHRDPSLAPPIAEQMTAALQSTGSRILTRVLESVLRDPDPPNGFFFSVVLGRTNGVFTFLYDPTAFEPVLIGAASNPPDTRLKLWTSYRPRSLPPYESPPSAISHYQINAEIRPDLSLQTTATFDWTAGLTSHRAISLALSRKLNIDSATVDGEPAEIVQEYVPDFVGVDSDSDVLIVPRNPVVGGRTYQLTLHYSGFVIRKISDTSYFVSERNVWYPHVDGLLTTFDLTFRCPSRFDLISSGEPVSDEVSNGIRTVHRKTETPQQLAGFNLGEYRAQPINSGNYHIECYADRSASPGMNNIPRQCQSVLAKYTARWFELPIHNLAVTPITGYFGQGFPGLIYLSTTAYQPEQDRPAGIRNARADTFFQDVLLPHEIAHQWWGNLVSAASYRSDWLMESMANYSALQLLDTNEGHEAFNTLMNDYRRDLLTIQNGSTIESAGPVDFGTRLLSAQGDKVWQVIVYEKGTWILHMLHQRLGDDRFRSLQIAILKRYAGKPITNEQFREAAAAFVPPGQPDSHLTSFFETWVYGTGLPTLHLDHGQLEANGVDNEWTADIPLACKSAPKAAERVRWQRIVSGSNPVPAACRLPRPSDFLYAE